MTTTAVRKSARSGLQSGSAFTHTLSGELLHRLPRLYECRVLVRLERPPCAGDLVMSECMGLAVLMVHEPDSSYAIGQCIKYKST